MFKLPFEAELPPVPVNPGFAVSVPFSCERAHFVQIHCHSDITSDQVHVWLGSIIALTLGRSYSVLSSRLLIITSSGN